MNTRKVDGDRTLFIEEFQSDWHQQARQYGYTRDETKALKRNTNKRMLEIGSMRTFFGKLDSNMSKLAIDIRKTHDSFDFRELYDQRTRTADNALSSFNLTKKQQKHSNTENIIIGCGIVLVCGVFITYISGSETHKRHINI